VKLRILLEGVLLQNIHPNPRSSNIPKTFLFFAKGHFNLGNAYQKLGRFDEAIEEYRLALILKPDSPGIHYNLGVIYRETGQLDEAIQEFKIALKLYPQFVEARKNLALATKEKESGK